MGRLPARAAERFLGAIRPLLSVDKGLLDVAVIALRKALFGKGGSGRGAACAGLCQVLQAVSAGTGACACTGGGGGAAVSLSQSLSQSRFGTGGVEAAERGVLLHEVFGLLRRGLGQQGAVRAQVYASLAGAVAAAPGLAPQAAALLYHHLAAFCPALGDGADNGSDSDRRGDNEGEDEDGSGKWPVKVEGVGEGGAEPVPLLVAALGRVAGRLDSDEGEDSGEGGGGVGAALERLGERVAEFDPTGVAGFVERGAEWKGSVYRLYRGVCGALIECVLCRFINSSAGGVGLRANTAAGRRVTGLSRRAAALGDYMKAVMTAAAAGGGTTKKGGSKQRRGKKGEDENEGGEEGKEEAEEEEDDEQGATARNTGTEEPPKKVARHSNSGSGGKGRGSSDGDAESVWRWEGQALLSAESVRVLAAGMEQEQQEQQDGEASEVWEEGVRRLVVGSALGHLRDMVEGSGGSGVGSNAGGYGEGGAEAVSAAAEFCLYVGSRLFGRYLAPLLRGNSGGGGSGEEGEPPKRESEEEVREGSEAVRLCVAFFHKQGSLSELCEFLRACIGEPDPEPESGHEYEEEEKERRSGRSRKTRRTGERGNGKHRNTGMCYGEQDSGSEDEDYEDAVTWSIASLDFYTKCFEVQTPPPSFIHSFIHTYTHTLTFINFKTKQTTNKTTEHRTKANRAGTLRSSRGSVWDTGAPLCQPPVQPSAAPRAVAAQHLYTKAITQQQQQQSLPNTNFYHPSFSFNCVQWTQRSRT